MNKEHDFKKNMREVMIVLLCNDYTQKDIANKLRMSISYVEKEFSVIKSIYGANTLTGLVCNYMIERYNIKTDE